MMQECFGKPRRKRMVTVSKKPNAHTFKGTKARNAYLVSLEGVAFATAPRSHKQIKKFVYRR